MTNENQVHIGERLKTERERLTLSQTAMAELAGTTKQTQYSYEVGKSPPKASYLSTVASLGVDVGYVITGLRAENVAHTPTELGYLRHCRTLSTVPGLAEDALKGLSFMRIAAKLELGDYAAAYAVANYTEEAGNPP